MLGEALVATINAHLQRHPTMNWAEVQAVVRVISAAVAAEVIGDAAASGRPD